MQIGLDLTQQAIKMHANWFGFDTAGDKTNRSVFLATFRLLKPFVNSSCSAGRKKIAMDYFFYTLL